MSRILKRVMMIALTVSVVSGYAGARQKRSAEPAAAREIRGLLQRQVQAWNRHELEGFMQGYWNSPDLTFFSAGTIVSGWEETLRRYRVRYQSGQNKMGHLEFTSIKIEILSPVTAFVRGRFYLTETETDSSGLFTLVFRKFPNGWKIVHDHTSTA